MHLLEHFVLHHLIDSELPQIGTLLEVNAFIFGSNPTAIRIGTAGQAIFQLITHLFLLCPNLN